MSQASVVIPDTPGLEFLSNLNDALAALVSNNSGAVAPAITYPHMFWADTGFTPPMLRQRNAGDTAWLPIGPLADLGIQSGAQTIATVGGTADAITLAFTPAWTAMNGGIFSFVAASDNATTTPTGNPNGLGAKTFIKGNNLALALGDIKSGMTMLGRYDSVLGKLVLLNPATGVAVSGGGGRLIGTTVYTANGTYTKATNNPSYIEVEVIGGGGGGGGSSVTAAAAGGGGGGGYSRKKILAASLSASETVTVGAAGAAGANTGGTGGTGGTSSFGAHASATGGLGGAGATALSRWAGGAYGSGSGGDVNSYGQRGGDGNANSIGGYASSGFGGSSILGGGGATVTNGANAPGGAAASDSGSGGGGGSAGGAGQLGGVGGGGRVIVREYA